MKQSEHSEKHTVDMELMEVRIGERVESKKIHSFDIIIAFYQHFMYQ